ncbi:accessory gene regulator protein A [Kosakonia phage Kc263]|uniref:Accessory gene regulator protein A n=1 Tax=Kosakonia phage Kc263 TaxID=2863194 RepID=A0AAE7WGM1_9CAUD|nr:accessory gene regulator protein A [Kosakonia phage Kc263]QYN79906.1 accessory gene regulator protein A [Kosakonia phage Kc263]
MKKELSLTLILYTNDDGSLNTVPGSVDPDTISHYNRSNFYNGDHTRIGLHNGNECHYAEPYETVKRMITDVRNQDIRVCYVIPIKGGTRYIPKDSVSHFFISKTNKLVTLTLNSGVKIPTRMTLPQLKETIKQVDMG